jgi:hypothetical protein
MLLLLVRSEVVHIGEEEQNSCGSVVDAVESDDPSPLAGMETHAVAEARSRGFLRVASG